MKKLETLMKNFLMVMLAVGVMTLSGCGEDDEEFVPTQTIYQLVQADSELSEMLGYIDADASLLGYAQGTTAYTLFAPNNAAFDKLRASLGTDDLGTVAPSIIASVMNYHFLAGENLSGTLYGGAEFTSVQGETNSVDATGHVVNAGTDSDGAEILSADNVATNGVMHVVETILVPPTIFGAIGVNLGTVAQPVLLGAAFTDIVGIIAVADSDVPTGEASITSMLANKDSTITVFVPANDVLTGAAAVVGDTKEQLIASFTVNAATARGFMMNHISAEGFIKGSDLVANKMITMLTGNTYIVVTGNVDAATNPLGIVLVNIADQTKLAPVFFTDLIDANSTGAGVNGSAHVSSILQ